VIDQSRNLETLGWVGDVPTRNGRHTVGRSGGIGKAIRAKKRVRPWSKGLLKARCCKRKESRLEEPIRKTGCISKPEEQVSETDCRRNSLLNGTSGLAKGQRTGVPVYAYTTGSTGATRWRRHGAGASQQGAPGWMASRSNRSRRRSWRKGFGRNPGILRAKTYRPKRTARYYRKRMEAEALGTDGARPVVQMRPVILELYLRRFPGLLVWVDRALGAPALERTRHVQAGIRRCMTRT